MLGRRLLSHEFPTSRSGASKASSHDGLWHILWAQTCLHMESMSDPADDCLEHPFPSS